ncbi:response regulator transcription factor [Wenzhouxiangella sp. XN79A]|uniref:response regulator transcription factor n=1 Tax=Wenzhouxiangella sp. XN79A TaxID=2724193 RepID=UPI00144A6FBB|nr:response regulator transcription factor [Wenzhouxiangella sp. XN79A]NKI35834.1 response regulator transcription factor [Wenzhouxiangella sp. XN79A]
MESISAGSEERLVVVDDHPLFRDALSAALGRHRPACRIEALASFDALQQRLGRDAELDLILLDLHLPDSHGLSGLAWLRGHHPELPVLMISAHDDPDIVQRALADGAAGFLSKSADAETLSHAIDQVLAGETWVPDGFDPASSESEESALAQRVGELTPQQYRILCMLGDGLLNKQIAWELDITEATVKAHMTAIMRKLAVNNRTQAVTLFNRLAVRKQDVD